MSYYLKFTSNFQTYRRWYYRNFLCYKKQKSIGKRYEFYHSVYGRHQKTLHDGVYLNSGINCSVQSAHFEMMTTKNRYRKADKRMFYQFVQSFPTDTKLTPQEVHQIGLEFVQKQFPQFEVLVSTHCNTKNLHNHILVNSVSFENGKKLHQNHDNLLEHRNVNDEICLKFGEQALKPYVKGQKNKTMKTREYRSAMKGESYKLLVANTIDDCMKYAQSKEHFIYLMESEGYKMTWTESRKNITFTNPKGNKSRDNSLHEDKYLKENLENEFRIRESFFGRTETAKPSTYDNDTTDGKTTDDRRFEPNSAEPNSLQRRTELDNGRPETNVRRDYFDTKSSKQFTDSDRFTENICTADRAENDVRTGWEAKREILFYGEIETAEPEITESGMVTDVATNHTNATALVGSVVGVGSAMEQLTNDVPVAPKRYRIDRKSLSKLIEKKQAKGQKHTGEDLENNFEMTM